MLSLLFLIAWVLFTSLAFYSGRTKLAISILALGLVDLTLIYFFGIGIFGFAMLAVIVVVGIVVFKIGKK